MQRFLKSMNYSDDEILSSDLEFESINRNRFDQNQYDIRIVKENPWEYSQLVRFQDGLANLSFKYTLQINYKNKPTSDLVIELMNEWYRCSNRFPCSLDTKVVDIETYEIIYVNEEESNQFKDTIKDFRDFLKFIGYDFIKIVETIKVEEVILDDEIEPNEVVEKNTETIDTNTVDNTNENLDRNEIMAQIEEEQKEKVRLAEDEALQQRKKNYELMRQERKKAALNRRGNYQYIEKIDDITGESGNVDFNGKVFQCEVNERGGGKLLSIGINDDFGGAIGCFCYQNQTINDELVSKLLKSNVRVRGHAHIDERNKQLLVKIHMIDLLPPDEIKQDKHPIKRVELHLHSNMSTQDGVTAMDDYCAYANKLAHSAMAITDHGCVQGFPDAQNAGAKYGIKMLYGCEFYMIDDEFRYIFNPKDCYLNKTDYVVLDLETTGLSARYNRIIEFGAVKISGGRILDRYDVFINPECSIPQKIQDITGITDAMVEKEKTIAEAIDDILAYLGDAILVTHNADFDISFLNEELIKMGRSPLKNGVIDTLALSRYLFPESRNHRLGTLCRHMDVKYDEESAHRADYDAFVLAQVWLAILSTLTKDNIKMKHLDLENLKANKELIKHLRPTHVIALAKNKKGLKDLYKLVSISNIDYLASVPTIPKRILNEYRSNLLLGSACFNGDVFQTARYYNEERLRKACSFYDYIEVQPPANYSHLVNMGDNSEEEIIQFIKDIIKVGKELGKLVVATGDVHYLTKKEKVFRDVYVSAPQVGKVQHPLNPYARANMPYFENPDQHYRDTEEMLECFNFLDEDLREEIVVTNTNIIADSIEALLPVPNNKLYTPTIDNCENMLKDLCFSRAHQLYGNPLPEFIQNRLDTELNGIITNGYSVIYYIAHQLVKKSNEDGYIVGSRGSVGSSFVATMSGITEVNPLPPHYLCPHCHILKWGKEKYPDVKSGFDLPTEYCPQCGKEMMRDGQDIPFETFLGFAADKVPDIDLNFPGDYQARAHDYTKVLLGADNVFRAGTIETVADKTAFGFARGYIERKYISSGLSKEEANELALKYPKAKLDYLASGCVGVKRTTGQHPGGIVVIPRDYEVYDFTPIQWPANEVDSAWKTTHFDFHSIHDTVLKLDMLGHVDPVALKMMCDLTHIKIEDIPMNDPDVLKIFSSPESLHLHSNYLNQETGAMAIPEFGTDFVRGILEKTRPTKFSDLVIISGLSHGTNVWNGNAETLISNKVATLQDVIGCRDDIMTYLINKGLPSKMSFDIMEDVRKGRGLKAEYIEAMLAHNVSQYYIDSCNKIKYMFPKGHAVAYVTMAIRVGYFKVHYPLEFYATFFSVRTKQYDIVPMMKGEEAIINRIEQLKNKEKNSGEKMSTKEEEQYKTLQIALEMVERGYKFANIDLYKSDAVNFVVDHENKALIPPFVTIDGLGENNAITVIEARKERNFTSKDDLLRRTKLTSTNVKDLADLGVLNSLSESDQLSLFDW